MVRGVHPAWTAAEVRSAVINTARQGPLRHPDTGAVTDDALIVGAGLLDVAAAIGAVAALDPVSQSFGQLTTGSGATRTAPIVVTNIGTVSRAYTASVSGDAPDGVTFATNGGTFTLAPGGSRTVSVSVSSVKGAAEGNHQAELTIVSGGTEVAHAMLYGLVGQGVRAPGQYMLPPPKA